MAEILAISREKWILILQEIEDLSRILYCILDPKSLFEGKQWALNGSNGESDRR